VTDWRERLPQDICSEASEWLAVQPDMLTAWRTCERSDWMLYQAKCPSHVLTYAVCQVARTALQFVPDGEHRPREAIETAEAWARSEGVVSEDELAAARAASWAAASDAARAAAWNTAWAAARNAAWAAALKESADIVRKHIDESYIVAMAGGEL